MEVQEIREWYRVRAGYWFRPKLFGFGAVPVTWQGWLAVLAFIAVVIPISILAKERGPAFLALLAPPALAFSWACLAKTDGSWRWRWGDTGRD